MMRFAIAPEDAVHKFHREAPSARRAARPARPRLTPADLERAALAQAALDARVAAVTQTCSRVPSNRRRSSRRRPLIGVE
jgi:hypothetical protein